MLQITLGQFIRFDNNISQYTRDEDFGVAWSNLSTNHVATTGEYSLWDAVYSMLQEYVSLKALFINLSLKNSMVVD